MLAVATSLPKFYQTAVKELEKEGISFLSLRPGEEIPAGVDIVITSSLEETQISFPKVISASEAAEAVREALHLKTGLKKSYSQISIGIDPGKSIGIAAVGDGRVIFEEIGLSPDDVVTAIKKVSKQFSAEKKTVKVGAAGGAYRNRIIQRLQESFRYPIEIVDEGQTTRPKVESRRLGLHKDILAARKIAFKTGKHLKRTIEVATTAGEIKNIQRESRKKSAHLTISKRLAESVVKGEIDLDEAIKLQRKRRSKDLHPS